MLTERKAHPLRSIAHRRWPVCLPALTHRSRFGAQLAYSFERQVEAGRQELNALEQALKSDPDYAFKRSILIPVLLPVLWKLPPSEWADAFAAAYAQLHVAPPGAATVNDTGVDQTLAQAAFGVQ
jgi:hypothetical protein